MKLSGSALKESIQSVLPIFAIVLVLSISLASVPSGVLVMFLFGTLLLIVGMGFFTIYSVTGKNRVNQTGEETFGMLYYAEISTFEDSLHSEMESISLFDELPTGWTYPLIQPKLIEEFIRRTT